MHLLPSRPNVARCMNWMKRHLPAWGQAFVAMAWISAAAMAQDGTPDIRRLDWASGRPVLRIAPVPSAQSYDVYATPDLGQAFNLLRGGMQAFQWTGSNAWSGENGFFRVRAQVLSPAAITAANLLNRLGYGPTPDELEEVRRSGVDAWINQQLSPEAIVEDLDAPTPLAAGLVPPRAPSRHDRCAW